MSGFDASPNDSGENNVVDVLFWVSHGNTIAIDQRYYPVENKFRGISTFAKPMTSLYEKDLAELGQNPCMFLLGNCPTINHKRDGDYSEAWLPPVVFSLEPVGGNADRQDIAKHMGLYHFRIELKKLYGKQCVYHASHRVLTNDSARAEFAAFDKVHFTYSDIFSFAYTYCKKMNIDSHNVVMGIFSCFAESDYLNNNYNITELLLPKAHKKVNQANIVQNNTGNGTKLTLLVLRTENAFGNWTALAKQKSKGCGLNVLSYYGVIDQQEARNQTVCLSSKGTSIFKIVDIYDATRSNKAKYTIIRTTLSRGIGEIFKFIGEFERTTPTQYNYGILFKMYEGLTHPKTHEDTHVGHTISIGVENTGNIFVFDPQSDNVHQENAPNLLIGTKTQLGDGSALATACLDKIGSLYGTNTYKYMDIILHDAIDPTSNIPIWVGELSDNSEQNYRKILVRQQTTTHGGRRFTNKRGRNIRGKSRRTGRRTGRRTRGGRRRTRGGRRRTRGGRRSTRGGRRR